MLESLVPIGAYSLSPGDAARIAGKQFARRAAPPSRVAASPASAPVRRKAMEDPEKMRRLELVLARRKMLAGGELGAMDATLGCVRKAVTVGDARA